MLGTLSSKSLPIDWSVSSQPALHSPVWEAFIALAYLPSQAILPSNFKVAIVYGEASLSESLMIFFAKLTISDDYKKHLWCRNDMQARVSNFFTVTCLSSPLQTRGTLCNQLWRAELCCNPLYCISSLKSELPIPWQVLSWHTFLGFALAVSHAWGPHTGKLWLKHWMLTQQHKSKGEPWVASLACAPETKTSQSLPCQLLALHWEGERE